MKIFDKRPLSLILCILLGAFVFFSFGTETERLILLAVAILLIIAALLFKEFSQSRRLQMGLISGLIIFASLSSYLYFDLWFNAYDRFGEECEIIGTVEKTNLSDESGIFEVKTESINDEILTSYKIRVLIPEDYINNITLGTKIKFRAKLKDFNFSSDFDSSIYYKSRGFSAFADEVTDFNVIGQENTTLENSMTDYRLELSRNLVSHSGRRVGGFLSALLLGEREYLDGQIKQDFSRIGISHILALSGLHISILCYGFSRILSLFHIDKRIRKIFEIIFAFLYMALTGFPVSVVRAGLMLIISSLLFLFSASKDTITNLFISVALICIITPYAIFDISLWLSAFATMGVIVSVQLFEVLNIKSKHLFGRFAIAQLSSLLSTVFALTTTLAISAFSFKTISLLAPIATILFSTPILILMYLGTLFLLTATFLPIGSIVVFCTDIVLDFASLISSFKYSLLSVDFIFLDFLVVIITIATFLFFVLDIRRKKLTASILSLSFLVMILSSFSYTLIQFSGFSFQYDETDSCERIIMKENSEFSVVEISNFDQDTAYKTVSYLKNNSILYLDNYIITSYNLASIEDFEVVLNNVYIKNVYLPKPKVQADMDFINLLEDVERGHSAVISYYESDDAISLNSFSFLPVYSDKNGRLAFAIAYKNEIYSYLSFNMLDNNTKNQALKIMNSKANTVILGTRGHHGFLSDFKYKIEGETKIIYNKKTSPSDETLDFYENRITLDPIGSIDLYVE